MIRNILLILVLCVNLGAIEKSSIEEKTLIALKDSIETYVAIKGHAPRGRNHEIILELSKVGQKIRFPAELLDEKGNLLDSRKRPYHFLFSEDGLLIVCSIAKADDSPENLIVREFVIIKLPLDGH